jgi:hypothetical protein
MCTTHSRHANAPPWVGGLAEFPVFISRKVVQIVLLCKKQIAKQRMTFIRKMTGRKAERMLLIIDLYVAYDFTEAAVRQLFSQ